MWLNMNVKMQETISVGGKQQDVAPVEEETTENVYEQLFSAVMNATDGNRSLCEAFKVLPLRSVMIHAIYRFIQFIYKLFATLS